MEFGNFDQQAMSSMYQTQNPQQAQEGSYSAYGNNPYGYVGQPTGGDQSYSSSGYGYDQSNAGSGGWYGMQNQGKDTNGAGRGTRGRGRGNGASGQRGRRGGRGHGGYMNQSSSLDPYKRAGWNRSSSWRGPTINMSAGQGQSSVLDPSSQDYQVQYGFDGKLAGPERNAKTFKQYKYCEICKVSVNSSVTAESHYSGKMHLKKMKEILRKDALKNENFGNQCEICNVPYNSLEQAEAHLQGSKHKQKVAERESRPSESGEPMKKRAKTGDQVASSGQLFPCDLCGITTLNPNMLASHRAGKKHKNKMQELERLSTELKCSKCNVTLESPEQAQPHLVSAQHTKRLEEVVKASAESQEPSQQEASSSPNKRKWDVMPDNVSQTTEAAPVATPSAEEAAAPKAPKEHKEIKIYSCNVCEITVTSQKLLDIHNQGKKHRKKLGLQPLFINFQQASFTCDTCKVNVSSREAMEDHYAGQRHKKNVGATTAFSCSVCDVKLGSQELLDVHLAVCWKSLTGAMGNPQPQSRRPSQLVVLHSPLQPHTSLPNEGMNTDNWGQYYRPFPFYKGQTYDPQLQGVPLPQEPVVSPPQQQVVSLPHQQVMSVTQQHVGSLPQQPVMSLPQQHVMSALQQPVVSLPQQPAMSLPQHVVSVPQEQNLSTEPKCGTDHARQNDQPPEFNKGQVPDHPRPEVSLPQQQLAASKTVVPLQQQQHFAAKTVVPPTQEHLASTKPVVAQPQQQLYETKPAVSLPQQQPANPKSVESIPHQQPEKTKLVVPLPQQQPAATKRVVSLPRQQCDETKQVVSLPRQQRDETKQETNANSVHEQDNKSGLSRPTEAPKGITQWHLQWHLQSPTLEKQKSSTTTSTTASTTTTVEPKQEKNTGRKHQRKIEIKIAPKTEEFDTPGQEPSASLDTLIQSEATTGAAEGTRGTWTTVPPAEDISATLPMTVSSVVASGYEEISAVSTVARSDGETATSYSSELVEDSMVSLMEDLKVARYGQTGRDGRQWTYYRCTRCGLEGMETPEQYIQHVKSEEHRQADQRQAETGILKSNWMKKDVP